MYRKTQQPRENCARLTLQTLDPEAVFSSSLFRGAVLYYLASATPVCAAASIRRFIRFLYTRPPRSCPHLMAEVGAKMQSEVQAEPLPGSAGSALPALCSVDRAVEEVHRVAKMRRWASKALNCHARGTWSRCGTRAGSRSGRPSTNCQGAINPFERRMRRQAWLRRSSMRSGRCRRRR